MLLRRGVPSTNECDENKFAYKEDWSALTKIKAEMQSLWDYDFYSPILSYIMVSFIGTLVQAKSQPELPFWEHKIDGIDLFWP